MARKKGKAKQTGSGLAQNSPNYQPVTPPAQAGQMMMDYLRQQQAKNAPAPPPPPTAPLPDPQFEAYKASQGRNLAVGNIMSDYQTGRVKQDYGFEDASNPYSRAKMLQESFKRSKLGTANSYAAQGQLNSGAYGRMQGENLRNYNIDYDRTRREYDVQLANIGFGRLQNTADYGISVDDEAFRSLLAQFGRK